MLTDQRPHRAVHQETIRRGRAPHDGAVPAPSGARAWLAVPDNGVFVLLLALSLLPIWAFAFFPSQDGPSHVHNAAVLAEYARADRTAFHEYYFLKLQLEPNLLGHLILAALILIFPALTAEKLLLSGYVVLLVVAARYAVGVLRPDARWLALLAFPLVYNYALHMGFYNYVLSLGLYMLAVGYWIRYQAAFTSGRALVWGGLLLLLYSAHLLTLGLALLSVGILATALSAAELVQARRSGYPDAAAFWQTLRSRALIPLFASLPVVVLVSLYFARPSDSPSSGLPGPSEVALRLVDLVALGGIVSLSRWEVVAAGGFACAVLVTAYQLVRDKFARRHAWDRGDLLLALVAAMLAVYLFIPGAMAGGSYIVERLGVMVYVAMLLWLAANAHQIAFSAQLRWAAVGVTLALLGIRAASYDQLNHQLAEYQAAAAHVQPNTTLLSLSFAHHGRTEAGEPLSLFTEPFIHASGYVGAERGVVVFDNYEGSFPFFPVQFRPPFDPFRELPQQYVPGQRALDLRGYVERTGARIDHVLLWDLRDEDRALPPVVALLRQLTEDYELVYESPAGRRAQLYRHRSRAAEPEPISLGQP
jgi:hypothetical protein